MSPARRRRPPAALIRREDTPPLVSPAGERHVPVTGDVYEWHGVTITIGEIGPGGRWCMIHCQVTRRCGCGREEPYVHEWDKQHPSPTLPGDWIKVNAG
jgi:hypothetical protein